MTRKAYILKYVRKVSHIIESKSNAPLKKVMFYLLHECSLVET